MRIIRFRSVSERWGVLQADDTIKVIEGEPFGKISFTGTIINLKEAVLLPPVKPSKIVAIGLNYSDHADELDMSIPSEPILFLKPPSSIIGHNDEIIYPSNVNQIDYEAELAVVISKKAKKIFKEQANEYILGFTCANDITARDIQRKEGQWSRAKGYDTFCPVGPWIETDFKPDNAVISCSVNGQTRQKSNIENMMFKVEEILEFVSSVMTLNEGDVILTGTPPGVGSLQENDKVDISIFGIGTLSNIIKKEYI